MSVTLHIRTRSGITHIRGTVEQSQSTAHRLEGARHICMASIFLIGPMGAGKTTVGRHLARRLNQPFYDSDREIESSCGVDIPTIFDFEGETGFRCREERMIDFLTRKQNIVLGTGGGAVLREVNRERLRHRGVVVFLDVDIDVQVERTSRNNSRPLLQQGDPKATLMEISRKRGPIYREVAHIHITTSNQRHQRVVDKICHQLNNLELPVMRERRRDSSGNPATDTDQYPVTDSLIDAAQVSPADPFPNTDPDGKK